MGSTSLSDTLRRRMSRALDGEDTAYGDHAPAVARLVGTILECAAWAKPQRA